MKLKNMHIAVTGTLSRMTRKQAEKAISRNGGIFSNHVNRLTDILVIAEDSFLSSKLQKAIELSEDGHTIQFIKEKEFYTLVKA